MKGLLIFICLCCCLISKASAQTYSIGEYPRGTSTVQEVKSKYSLSQIKSMLDNSDMYRNVDNPNKIGITLIDPDTSGKMIVCDIDSTFLMFEYIKILRLKITTLELRLQAAGIP